MSNTVISVENLSKAYRLGQITTRTLNDDLKLWWARTRGKPNPLLKVDQIDYADQVGEVIWALKDISYQVNQGEILGIIGKNGAGKSTLLKILSRVTAPTSGKVKLKGRIASLLEVGTGFHPDLTGRENIYLNGAILGMTKEEVKRKFDEIVYFSGIDQFIDTPVKRYSSGMYVRLAFAVAAHLESEILLVDEVLAVGDAEFQKKCLGKMGDVASNEGRTVLFVSHNMAAVRQTCNLGILIDKGQICLNTDIGTVVSRYLNDAETRAVYVAPYDEKYHKLKILQASLLNEHGEKTSTFTTNNCLTLNILVAVAEDINAAQLAFELISSDDLCLFSTSSQDYSGVKEILLKGKYSFTCDIDLKWFRQGRYKIKISSSIPSVEILDAPTDLIIFDIVDVSSPIIKLGQNRRGVILPVYLWRKEKLPSETK